MAHGRARLLLVAALVAMATILVSAPPVGAHEPSSVVAAPTIVPFEDWAPATCPRPTGADVATTDRVVVHHSHHPTAATPDAVLPALAEMCDLHVLRGFDTVGYHYVVDPWGRVYQGRGRLPDEHGHAPAAQPEGAHVHGSNPGAVGVVFLGDHQAAPPTTAAVDAAVGLLAWLVEATGRDPGSMVGIESSGGGTALHEGHVEVPVVAGHRATNATLCPGEHLVALLEPIRQRIRDRITGAGGVLVVTDVVRPAPDGVAHVATSTPILRAPPVEPGLPARNGLLGLLPTTVALTTLLLLHPRWRRNREALLGSP